MMYCDCVMLLYIAAGAGLAALTALAYLAIRRLIEEGHQNSIWKSLRGRGDGEVFHAGMVEGLPEPAKRYLLHSIRPGTILATSVVIRMSGKMRPKATAPWASVKAREILSVPLGFLWRARVRRSMKRFSGADSYSDGKARVGFWFWGIFPAMRMEDEDTKRSAIGRLAIESAWLPAALLPQAGAKWEPVSSNSAKVTLNIDGAPNTLTLTFNPDGGLRRSSLSRWGAEGEGGKATWLPYQVDVLEETEFGGYTIPSFFTAGWWVRQDYFFEFFRATVNHAEFD